MVGLDSGADDEGLGELAISLGPCREVDATDILIKGGLLTVDEEVTLLMLVCWGDEERTVMLDSPGG